MSETVPVGPSGAIAGADSWTTAPRVAFMACAGRLAPWRAFSMSDGIACCSAVANCTLIAAAAYAIHYLPIAPFQIASADGFRRLLGMGAPASGWVTLIALSDCRQLVKRLMPTLIVLTGARLNLSQTGAIGDAALPITVACIVVAFGHHSYSGGCWGRDRKCRCRSARAPPFAAPARSSPQCR